MINCTNLPGLSNHGQDLTSGDQFVVCSRHDIVRYRAVGRGSVRRNRASGHQMGPIGSKIVGHVLLMIAHATVNKMWGQTFWAPGPDARRGPQVLVLIKRWVHELYTCYILGARAHWYGHGTSRKYTLEGRLVRVETQHWGSQRRVAKMATAGNVNRK